MAERSYFRPPLVKTEKSGCRSFDSAIDPVAYDLGTTNRHQWIEGRHVP
jgi:hypothetical protein